MTALSKAPTAGGPCAAMSEKQTKLMFLLTGGVMGAVLGLLFAPKSGSSLRQDIGDLSRKGYDGAADLVRDVKDRVEKQSFDSSGNISPRSGNDILELDSVPPQPREGSSSTPVH